MITRIMIPCDPSIYSFNKNSILGWIDTPAPIYICSRSLATEKKQSLHYPSEGLQGNRYYRTALSIKQAILHTRITNPIVEGTMSRNWRQYPPSMKVRSVNSEMQIAKPVMKSEFIKRGGKEERRKKRARKKKKKKRRNAFHPRR